jgi:nucleotide-binding universal stress UspA family protein
MKTILASIDFSSASQPVAAEAVKLARSMRARLVLLHVVQPPVVTDSEVGAQMSADYSAAAEVSAEKRLIALKKSLQAKGVSVVTKQLLGNPGQNIITEATKLNAAFIVLGSHGHGAFYELVIGSTTSRVLKQARCPVLVVPQKKTGK